MRYDEYKDSGVEWIGEVPRHWEIRRIKSFSTVKRGASPRPIDDPKYFDDNGKYAWVRIADVTASERYLESTTQRLSKLGASLSVKRHPGDIFLSIAGSVGKPIISKIECCIHDGFVWFPQLKLNPEFLYYIFLSGRPYLGLGKMGTQLNLNTETVANIFIPTPPKDEIDAVVSYLDTECGKIDGMIATQNKRIELLQELKQSIITTAVTRGLNPDVEFKDSGVEWIGEVPRHWDVIKTSRAYNKIGSGTTPSTSKPEYYTENEDGFNWLQTGDLNDGYITSTSKQVTQTAVNDCNLKFYKKGALVVALYGATIGKIGLLDIDTATNQACCVLDGSKFLYAKFSYYTLLCAKPALLLEANGGGQPNISQDIIRRLMVPLPPIDEQRAIAAHLDKKCARIDSLISALQRRTELLQELKQSLITEVVTGKRKVC